MENSTRQDFTSVKLRLDEIVAAVSDESLSLDAALKLYEEAVALGLALSNALEEDIAKAQSEIVIEADLEADPKAEDFEDLEDLEDLEDPEGACASSEGGNALL